MADYSVDPYDLGEPKARRRRSVLSLAAGAAVSAVALFAAVSWLQGLTTRDPSEIPFLRAEGGPMKVQPDDPGGLKMGGVDEAVTRMLTDDGAAGEVALAPEAEAPTDEDLPASRLERSAAPVPPVEVVSLGDPAAVPPLGAEAEAQPAPGPLDGRAIDEAVEQALREAPAPEAPGNS
ncbi:MAG: hypothetical protein AAGI51_14955, partial [Pseudomonadota bacterium]